MVNNRPMPDRAENAMTPLERAIRLALEAHAGQKSKDGSPYILHPLRLMAKMETAEERMSAVLHDVVEDSHITLDDLRAANIPERVLEAVRLLTHEEGTSYEAYVERLRADPLARKIKIADLEDNSDIRRLSGIEEKDLERLQKYHRAWQILRPSPGEI